MLGGKVDSGLVWEKRGMQWIYGRKYYRNGRETGHPRLVLLDRWSLNFGSEQLLVVENNSFVASTQTNCLQNINKYMCCFNNSLNVFFIIVHFHTF